VKTETTGSQDRDFNYLLFGQFSPNTIFDALRDLFLIDSSFVLDWVRDNFTPEEIFSSKELEQWAKDNGYN
jgi:hypothetical protein